MKWRLRRRRGPGDGGTAELDARLSQTWEAAAGVVGKMIDLPAGKEALLASSGLSQERTPELRAPAGMTRRGSPRRRQRWALRLAAGVGAALAAGAVALAVIGVPGAGHHGTERSAVDTAYVVKRVNDALSMAGPGEIAQMTVAARSIVLPGGVTLTGATEEWSYGGRWRLVTYSPAGQLVYDAGSSATGERTLVSYLTRTWTRSHGRVRVAPLPECERAAAALPSMFVPWLPGTGSPVISTAADVGTALRTAVSCGTLTVTGQQRVDGVEAIELTSRPDSPVSETIWVSPDTYLPVRVVVRPAGLAPLTADITWLRGTPQNLDKLTVPVPAGFRRVPTAPRLRRRDESRSRACASMPGRRDMARTYRRRPGLVVLVAAAAIGLAACSSGSSTPQVASLGKNSSSTNSSRSNTTSPSGTPAQLLAEWTSCMRSHGDPSQANPTIDTNKNIHIVNSLDIKGGLQHTSEAQACNSYLTAASNALGGNQPPGPPNPKLVAYAKCMRANGVPNFPDPTGNGIVIKGNGIDASSPVFLNANKLCTQQTGGGPSSGGGGAPPLAGLIFWGRAAQGGGTGAANG